VLALTPNQTLQPTADRPAISHTMIKTFNSAAQLGLVSGG